jgi:hypothetical protein
MIRKLLLAVVLAALPVVLTAAEVLDRDVLLTPAGTLYTVDTEWARDHAELNTPSATVVFLTVQQNGKTTKAPLPESLTGGAHVGPVLAYDATSDTLFVLWQRMVNVFSSDFLLCTYQNGKWTAAEPIDSVGLHMRGNLRIAVTQKIEVVRPDGSVVSSPEVTVHAVWWDDAGDGQYARYAMLTVENARVSSIQISDLRSFVDPIDQAQSYPVDPNFNRELLRHPAIFESSTHDTIDVVFADWNTNAFHRITIRPVLKTNPSGRPRVPIGVRQGGFGPSRNFQSEIDGELNVMAAGSGNTGHDKLLFYFMDSTGAMNYTIESDGLWTPVKKISINDQVSVGTAVDALRRLISSVE